MIFRLYYKRRGGHVHCRLFCGPQEGALGKCGDLTFRLEEFTEFTRIRQSLAIDFRSEEVGGEPVVFHENVRDFIYGLGGGKVGRGARDDAPHMEDDHVRYDDISG